MLLATICRLAGDARFQIAERATLFHRTIAETTFDPAISPCSGVATAKAMLHAAPERQSSQRPSFGRLERLAFFLFSLGIIGNTPNVSVYLFEPLPFAFTRPPAVTQHH